MPLWIVATPIGTLADCSPRAKQILGSATMIAAEDTRMARKLLTALEIPAPPLVALHAHNEDQASSKILDAAVDGDLVLVSDAGTPAISDPGEFLVMEAHRRGIQVLSVPGPSALASALAASGIPAIPSAFLGFPPRKGREGWVREALGRSDTLVMYEAPTRISELVALFAENAPDREACMCREISKKFEENLRMPLPKLAEELSSRESIRGECVLVIGPGAALVETPTALAENAGLKDLAGVLAERCGVSKKEAYSALLELERTLSGDRA